MNKPVKHPAGPAAWTPQRRVGKHTQSGHDLGVAGGLSALSLDALSSVAYGPEAMMLVLVTAGVSALRYTLPLTLVITAMLAILVVSYTQVIAAHPDGGGSYAVAKRNLGRWPALLAAASLVIDYVLTVAVSLAAGAASLGSVFPTLSHHLLAVSLVGLALLTAVNMFGITESAKLLLLPTGRPRGPNLPQSRRVAGPCAIAHRQRPHTATPSRSSRGGEDRFRDGAALACGTRTAPAAHTRTNSPVTQEDNTIVVRRSAESTRS